MPGHGTRTKARLAASAAALALAYAAAYASGLFAPLPAHSRAALGCIDHESAAILRALETEASAAAASGDGAVMAFHAAHESGLKTSDRYDLLRECAIEFARSSPHLASGSDLAGAVEAVGDSVVEVFTARARVLAAELDGDVRPASASMARAARLEMESSFRTAQTRISTLAEWVAEQVARH